jgi:V8-like Glu-specific endopeptidase
MVTLQVEDRQKLINLLAGTELMFDVPGRRQALFVAGLDKQATKINLTGASATVTFSIINFLAQLGHIVPEQEALGSFLSAFITSGQLGLEDQDELNKTITKYNMMVPVALNPPTGDWKNPTTDATVVEKVFGENTLRSIAFLQRGLEVAKSVMFIEASDGTQAWSGTGSLIAPGLALTNHHVISDAGILPNVKVKFNYQDNWAGQSEPSKVYKAKPGGMFRAKQELDYAVFEVDGEPEKDWNYLPLAARDIKQGQRINIIQHPNGQPKKITMQNNLVEYVGGNVLQYVTSTNPGSSGSPVFNDDWQVVGLHHAGGNIKEPTTGKFYNRNEGILIIRILNDLPQDIRKRIDDAAAAAG